MNQFIKTVSAVCAAAAVMGSVPVLPVSAETVTRTHYYAMADMGADRDFNRVDIDWNGSAPDEYRVESSDDGETWTEMENDSTEPNMVNRFTFNDISQNNCYGYINYHAKYVRVVSDEDISKAVVRISESEDVAPLGSAMQFETSDGSDIKSTSTEKVDERLNKKNIATSSYIYWGNAAEGTYDFDAASIIIPLGGAKEISRFETASYYNTNTNSFTNFFAKNYEISYINSSDTVHADNAGWIKAAEGAAQSGKLVVGLDKVNATHIKFTLSGGGVAGRNNSKLGSSDDTNITKIATFLSYIGVYTAAEVPSTMKYGTFEAEADAPEDMGTVDLVMFMGQSNMAGRGTASESIVCPNGHGYEFRAVSDPTRLYDAKEPFGLNENNPASGVNEPGAKTGSMVSALMESYYSYTGVPMVGVSCAKGGTQIDFWQPGGAALNDAVERYKAAKSFLKKNGYTVRRKFMVWCQGESDGDAGTPIDEYKAMTQNMAQTMMNEGIEKCFMVRIGHYRDNDKYDAYIEAQSQLCAEDDRFVMASEKFADMRALMKDVFHYQQEAYNITGTDAGENIAKYYGDEKKINLPSTITVLDQFKTDDEAGVTIDSGFDGVVLAALYNKKGVLEQSRILSDNTKANTVKFNISEDSKAIRLFNWDSIDKMTPIGESKRIALDSIADGKDDTPTPTLTSAPTAAATEPPQEEEQTYLTIAAAEADARTEKNNDAAAAIDGDQSTRWSSSVGGDLKENTITFDLGESKCVSGVEIDFYGTGRVYDFDIKVSNDGVKWKTVGTFNSKGKSAQNEYEVFAFADPVNTRYIQYSGRGSNNGTNIYNSFWEFRPFGLNGVDPDAENAPEARLAEITVTRDEETTTYDSIGLKWTCESAEDSEEVKFYSVERVMDGVTEFKTEGEVSDTKYVDTGSAQRPQYGPYEIDYSEKSDDGQYFIADLDQNKNPLSDAGKTTFIYEAYEGVPLVSGGEYGYIVKGYSAGGELVAQSDLTMLRTKEKEKTASIVFSGEPSAELTGYNMSVSAVTKMEQGEYGGISGWHFIQNEPGNQQYLGLKLDDNSGLTGAEEDKGYLVKITWADRFYNHAATARLNLQRTANEQYNTTNYDDAKNFIRTVSGSGGEKGKWYTMEFAYYGKNNHSLTVDGALSDIALNGYFAGQYGRFYIKSIEVSEWNGPEERPFEINMPAMFTDDMILQRNNEINIWGRIDGVPQQDGEYIPADVTAVLSDENGTEIARGTGQSAATRRADWTLALDNTVDYEPGKAYSLKITAEAAGEVSEVTEIRDIIFGDVYLCAGQSNMKYGPEYKNWTDYNADLDNHVFDNDNIRIISNENSTVSAFWETDTVGWRKANTDTIRELSFSATGAYFAKHLYEGNGNVPIGLLSSAVGGAGIENFLINSVKDPAGNILFKAGSVLYNRQIYPYTNGFNGGNGMRLAGIIWYQGEADASGAKLSMSTYTKAMELMVNDYRTVFHDDDLPFMYVQLAAFDNPSGEYAPMREAQFNYMIGKNTDNGRPKNVGMAVITDNTDNIKDIHPRNKSEVGRRLSLWARKLVYNQEDIEYTGPIFENAEPVEVDGKKALTITFEEGSVMNGLELREGELVGMKIAGEDKNFAEPDSYALSADQKSITVMSEAVEAPVYVQYGYYKLPTDASLFNADGLPASPFRNYE